MHIQLLAKLGRNRFINLGLLLLAGCAAFGLAGCSTTDYQKAMIAPETMTNLISARLNVDDKVIVTLSDIPNTDSQTTVPEERPIQGDGTISMPYIGRVQAAGKTPGELEVYIHELYVPKIYTHLTVTVKTSSDRVYFVGGEVKQPNRVLYVGPVTVSKAITSAGDFTDFADRKHVVLMRSDGQRFVLNVKKILLGKEPDPPVFPGDRIDVPRRWY